MNNSTNVTTGVWAGALAALGWGVSSYFGAPPAPPELVSASTVVITGLVQFLIFT